jgi:hypothetical protein
MSQTQVPHSHQATVVPKQPQVVDPVLSQLRMRLSGAAITKDSTARYGRARLEPLRCVWTGPQKTTPLFKREHLPAHRWQDAQACSSNENRTCLPRVSAALHMPGRGCWRLGLGQVVSSSSSSSSRMCTFNHILLTPASESDCRTVQQAAAAATDATARSRPALQQQQNTQLTAAHAPDTCAVGLTLTVFVFCCNAKTTDDGEMPTCRCMA